LGLAVALAAGTITTLTAENAAALPATCKPTVRIFTVQADGDLWLYDHAGPVNGSFAWAGARQVGWGWGGKTFAGANGRVYNITTTGELRKLRYNGSGWDTYPNGLQYETIGWGWQRYLTERDKITTDAEGSIYTLEGDRLRWWMFNEQSGQWSGGSGRTIDVGWSRFHSITGSAPGALQARDSQNVLHRFRFDRTTERAMIYDAVDGSADWRPGGQILSPGGDIYYSVRADTGDLVWNYYLEHVPTWNAEKVVGRGWGTDLDVTASTTDCEVTDLPMPNTSRPAPGAEGPASIALPSGTDDAHVLGVDTTGGLYDLNGGEQGWTTTKVTGQYVGVSDGVTGEGDATLATTSASTGDVTLHRVPTDRLPHVASLAGRMETKPEISRRGDGTISVYAAGDRGDGTPQQRLRKLYVREQILGYSQWPEFRPWRDFGHYTTDYTGEMSVVSRVYRWTLIVARTSTGEYDVFRHVQGAVPTLLGRLPGGPFPGRVVLSGDGGYGVYAFARVGDALSYLHYDEDRGFEGQWRPVADAAAKHVTGDVLSAGEVEGRTVVTATGDCGVCATITIGENFQAWQQVAPDAGPAALLRVFPVKGTQIGVLTGPIGARRLYTAPSPAWNTPMEFTGGPIG
jgi:hypothetical protein